MKRKLLVLIVVLILAIGALPSTVGAGGSSAEGAIPIKSQWAQAQVEEPPKMEGTTPFQQALQDSLAQRAADGKPVPSSVIYEYEVNEPVRPMSMRSAGQEQQGQNVIITATTTIVYQNPQQAGFDAWPSFDSTDTENFDELLYQQVEQAAPGYWDTHVFGQEPRKQTYVETYILNYETQEIQAIQEGDPLVSSTDGNILMGFTFAGPNISYIFEKKGCFILWDLELEEGEECIVPLYDIKVGFWFDFSFGLRLPAEVTLNGPAEMTLGSNYGLSATLNPQDWEPEQYTDAGVVAKDGNEFVLAAGYFIGAQVKFMGVDICKILVSTVGMGGCYSETAIDKSTDFITPLGENAYFPIPSADIPVQEWGLSDLVENGKKDNEDENDNNDIFSDEVLEKLLRLEIGISLKPNIGSDKITANWNAVEGSNCGGSGEITFSAANTPVPVGPVTACSNGPTGLAQVRLSDFRYYFNQFKIETGIYLKFKVIDDIEWDFFKMDAIELGPWYYYFLEINLSDLADASGLYLGKHYQCHWESFDNPFVCGFAGPNNEITLSVPTVDLIPPTSSVSLNGTAGNNGWYVSDVEVSLSAEDNKPGCSDAVSNIQYRLNGGDWTNYTVPFLIDQEGLNTLDFYAMDDVGNIETQQTQVVKIDKTPPILSAVQIPPPNSYGWNRTDVTIHFEATDTASGINTVTPDQLLSSEGANQSVTGTAVDMAGWTSSFTVTGINIDKSQPSLTITSPMSGMYANTSSFTVSWSASDALSGIASETGMIDGQPVQNGQVVYLLLIRAGSHLFAVNTVDKADNVSQSSVPVFVTVDINGLIAVNNKVCNMGWIDKPGVCNSLYAKLRAAKAAIDRGRSTTAINQLNAFINELTAQNSKTVSESAFTLLRADALYVISQLKK